MVGARLVLGWQQRRVEVHWLHKIKDRDAALEQKSSVLPLGHLKRAG